MSPQVPVQILMLAALCTSCSDPAPRITELTLESIPTACSTATLEAVSVTIDELDEVDWDRLHVFPPYTPRSAIESALGFEWDDPRVHRLAERDDAALLVLVKGNRVVGAVLHPRNRGDFSEIDPELAIRPAHALFQVEIVDRGDPWCVVRLRAT